jgi:hypothetical protein
VPLDVSIVIDIEVEAEPAAIAKEETEAGMLERTASAMVDTVRPMTLLQEDGILAAVPATNLTAAHRML